MTSKMMSVTLTREIAIIEETVQLLAAPEKFGVSTKTLFELLNASAMSATASASGVYSKTVDFPNLVALGQLLAEQRNLVYEDPEQAMPIAQFVYNTLSTHVYINNRTSAVPNSETHSYAPDLRLVVKNVLVLFVSFLNRYIEPVGENVAMNGSRGHGDRRGDADELESVVENLVMLFNVSILSKLHELFRKINPELKLKYDAVNGLLG